MKSTYLAATAACALGMAASAIGAEPQARPEPSCIEVEVDGQRTPAYDCLSAKLLDPAAEGRDPRPEPQLGSERIAAGPGNTLALFNQAATHQRMGNAFGKSMRPQRPPPPVFGSPAIKKP